MMDLRTRLEHLGGPIETAADETIGADLVRGRRAVRRRRVVRTTAGSAFGVAALAAAFAFGAPGGDAGAPGAAGGASRPPAVAQSRLEMVDYRGPQPEHFTIDKVPQGYFVQKDYYGGLTIASNRVRNPGPGVDPSKDPMYDPQDMTGKIAVFLEQRAFRGEVTGERLTVGGHEAVLLRTDRAQQLIISVSPEVYATVQVDVPLSREQILELGAGLHVSRAAIDRAATPVTGKGPGD